VKKRQFAATGSDWPSGTRMSPADPAVSPHQGWNGPGHAGRGLSGVFGRLKPQSDKNAQISVYKSHQFKLSKKVEKLGLFLLISTGKWCYEPACSWLAANI